MISYYVVHVQPNSLDTFSKMPGTLPYSYTQAQGLAGGLGSIIFIISLVCCLCLFDEAPSGQFASFLCIFSIPNLFPIPILFAAALYGIVFWNNPALVSWSYLSDLSPELGRSFVNQSLPVRTNKFWRVEGGTIDAATFRYAATFDRVPVYAKYSAGSDGQFHETQYEGECTPCSSMLCGTERCARIGDAYYISTVYAARVAGDAAKVSLWALAQAFLRSSPPPSLPPFWLRLSSSSLSFSLSRSPMSSCQ